MYKRLFLIGVLLLTVNMLFAQTKFVKSAQTESAELLQSGDAKTWCPVCGMNLKMFYKTNHALELADGTTHQYCSIRCLAVDLKKHPGQKAQAQVVDAKTERFIPAKDAYYVIGSKVPGTMTRESKLAFASKRDAKKFSKARGGKSILRFEGALDLARNQMKADNAMLTKKKKSVVLPKGKKLYDKFCGDLGDLPKFNSISDLKAYLKVHTSCKTFDEKQLQMVALYITSMHQPAGMHKPRAIKTPEDKKCPVCGMFVYKYPRWAAVLDITTNGQQEQLYFDGVKDLVKFYHNPQKWGKYKDISIQNILVTDYYQQVSIYGKKVYYVIGSDILGPMGHELIPFESKAKAEVFLNDHAGTQILTFDEITEQVIVELDK